MSARAMARTFILKTEKMFHPEMSRLNEVAPSNICCSNTRGMSAGARAEFGVRAHALRRPPHLSTRMLPSTVHVRGHKRRRESKKSKMLGIRGVRQGGYMSARAMARTHIRVTELVSHREMSPLKEVAPLNMSCSKTRCMSAGERAEFGVRAHALRRPPHLSTRMLPSAVHIRGHE